MKRFSFNIEKVMMVGGLFFLLGMTLVFFNRTRNVGMKIAMAGGIAYGAFPALACTYLTIETIARRFRRR